MDVEADPLLDQPDRDRAPGELFPPGLVRASHDDLTDVVERAKSRMASTGSLPLMRTTSAPSSLAFSMLARRCRWTSASISSGASCGPSMKTTNQSVLKRPASREPRRSSIAARGGCEDMQTITRRRVDGRGASSVSGRVKPARSTLSATSRRASSRRWARFWA